MPLTSFVSPTLVMTCDTGSEGVAGLADVDGDVGFLEDLSDGLDEDPEDLLLHGRSTGAPFRAGQIRAPRRAPALSLSTPPLATISAVCYYCLLRIRQWEDTHGDHGHSHQEGRI